MGGYVLASLLVMGAVTLALRWAPFAFVRVLRDSEVLRVLGRTMPVGVMVALVAFTLAGAAEAPGPFWPAPVALVATVALQLWRRSMALSIFAGTALYMVLVNLVA
ncbi:branched-chain amino acid transporter permease [Corynebacterium sp. 335C]